MLLEKCKLITAKMIISPMKYSPGDWSLDSQSTDKTQAFDPSQTATEPESHLCSALSPIASFPTLLELLPRLTLS